MEPLNFFRKRFLLLFVLTFLSWTYTNAQNAGPDQTIACEQTTLDADDTESGVWTTSGGATIDDPTNPNTLVTDLVVGDNVFTWTVGGNSDDVTITYMLANAGTDLPDECSSATLAAANPAPLSGYWTTGAAGVVFDDSTNPTATVSNLPQGSTNLTWTIESSSGCSNSDVVSVTNNTPTADAGTDDETCNNNSYQLNANDPASDGATGKWSIVSGTGTFADETLYNTVVSGMQQDNNEFQWTVTKKGCSASDNVVITNNTVFATASNQEVCATTATLDGNNPNDFGSSASGTWTTVGGTGASISNPNKNNTNVTSLDPDANQFNWEITKGGCSADTTITITNNSVSADAGPDQSEICADNATLAANSVAGATGQWTVVSGSGTFADNADPNTVVSGLSDDWNEYTWTLTKGICSDDDNVQIQKILPNTADAGPDQSVCGSTASLTANAATATNSAGVWSVISGGAVTFVDDTDPTTDIDGLDPGDNVLNWRIYSTVDNSCYTEDQVTITDITLTGVTAGPDQHVCGSTATMQGSDPGSGSGLWTLISGTGNVTFPTLSNSPVTGLGQGANTFDWTVTGGGCSGSDQVVIYNDFPSTADAGVDDESCDGTYVLAANNPVIGTGMWSSLAAGPVFANPTVFNTTVSNLNGGINTLTWTITNGSCSDSDDVIITNNTVTTPDAGADQQGCTNTYTLAAQDPAVGSGQWSVILGNGVFADPTLYNTSVVVTRGDNTLRWTVTQGGCSEYDEVIISNYSVEANAGNDDYTCDGTYQLSGNNPALLSITNPPITATGTWTANSASPPITFSDPNQYNATVSNLVKDDNSLTWTIDNGYCTASDVVVISNDMPTIPNAGNDTIFCGIDFAPQGYSEDFVSLNANAVDATRGETGAWTIVAGGATFVDPTTDPQAVITDLDHYSQLTGPDYWNQNPTINTFRWTITYKNCELSDEVSIVNAAPFAADAGPDQTVCFDEANLNAVDHGSGAQTHYWIEYDPGNSGAIITRSNDFNAYVYNLQSNQTTFRWTKENTLTFAGTTLTCTIWDDMIVDRPTSDLGRPNAGPDQILCSTEADMSASPADYGFDISSPETVTGEWSVLVGTGNFADITDPSTHVTDLAYRTNIFRWTVTYAANDGSGFECIATDDVDITNALPSNANAGPDQITCDSTALLAADRPTRGWGEWTVVGGSATLVNPTCQDFTCSTYAYGLSTMQNTFLWTMRNSYTDPATGETRTCELSDTLQVWNYGVTSEAGNDITVCNDTVILSANDPSPNSGLWLVTGGSGTVDDATAYNSMVSGLSPDVNTFEWRVSNAYCSESDFVNVTNNNPTDPTASASQPVICTDTVQINGTNPTEGYGTWTQIVGGGLIENSLAPSTWVRNIENGTNTFVWTITKGACSESDTVSVYNNSVFANAGSDIDDVCGMEVRQSSVTLNASPPSAVNGEYGQWTVSSSTGNIQTPSAYNTIVTGMDRGINRFRWTLYHTQDGVTCSDDDEVIVKVYIPSTAVAGADQPNVCASPSDVLSLNGNNPQYGTGRWTVIGGANIHTPTLFNTTISNLAQDISYFIWTITDNPSCPSSRDTVMFVNNYVYSDAGPDQDICTDTTTLAANNPIDLFYNGFERPRGSWTTSNGSVVYADNTLYNTQISNIDNTQANVLIWRIEKGVCWDEDQVTINNGSFTVSADNDQVVCDNWATLNGSQPQNNETGLWTISGGGGSFVDETLYNTRVDDLVAYPTANTFKWTITRHYDANCSASDEVTVYWNKVEADAGLDDRVCTDTTSMKAVAPANGQGLWTVSFGGATVATPSSNTSHVSDLHEDRNTFVWTVSNNLFGTTCSATDEVDIYNDTPSNAVAEADNEVCEDNTVLDVTTEPTIGQGVWTALNNVATIDNPSSYHANVTGLNRGDNLFAWTVKNYACTSVDTLVITNNMVIANAGDDKSTSCNDYTTLSANDPSLTQGSGLWSDLSASGAVFVTPSAYNSVVNNLAQGTSQFKWEVTLGSCVASDTIAVTNNQINAIINTTEVDICGTNVYGPLDGNDVDPFGTGIWTTGNTSITFDNNTIYNTTARNLPAGDNVLTWTVTSNDEGCTDYANVTIHNNSVYPNAGADIETCDADVKLAASPLTRGSGYWTAAGPTTVTFDDSTDPGTWVHGLAAGDYTFRWNVSFNGCSDYDEVVVSNNTPQTVSISGLTEVCYSTVSLTGTSPDYTNDESGRWTLVGASGGDFNDPTNATVTISNMPLGDNTYRWTLSKGSNLICYSYADYTVTNNFVIADAGPDQSVCSTSTSLAANDPNVTQGSGEWTGGAPAIVVTPTLYNSSITNIPANTTVALTWTVTKGSCSASDNVNITNGQVLANAGADEDICTDTYTLNGNDVAPAGATGLWTKQSGSPAVFTDETLYNTLVSSLASGVNIFTWTVTSSGGACTHSDEVYITNNKVVADAGLDQEVCGSTTDLDAIVPASSTGSGYWTQTGGAPTLTISDSTDPKASVAGMTNGNYRFLWTYSDNGCSDNDEVIIINDNPQIVTISGATETCFASVTLTGTTPDYNIGESGEWTLVGASGGDFDDPTNATVNISNMPLGDNTYRWTLYKGSIGCKSYAEYTVANNKVVADAGSPQNVCSSSTSLSANDPNVTQGSGEWTGGAPAIVVTPTLYNSSITNIPANTTVALTWTVTKGTCSASDNVNITNGQVLANAGADEDICTDTYTLNGNDVAPAGATGLWTKQSGSPAIFTNETVYNTQVNSLASGINIFTWTVTSATGCTDTDDVSINYNQVVANAGIDKELCESSTDLAAVVSGSGSGYWTQTSGAPTLSISDSTDPEATISGMTGGNYTFSWTFTNDGCSDSDDVLIINSSPQQATANALPESCDGTGWLNGNTPAAQETGLWVKVDAGGIIIDASSENATVSNMKQGNNIYKWTLTKGNTVTCVSEATVTIVNNEILNVVANSGTGQNTTCDGTITLSGTNPADENADRGEWTVNTGAIIDIPSLYQTSASALVAGDNDFTWTLYKGTCDKSSAPLTITNNAASAQIIAPTGTDKEVCDGTVSLTATSSTGNGVWELVSGAGQIQNSLNTTTSVTGLEKNNNIFRWTVDNGDCVATDEITIVNNQVFPQANDKYVCEDLTRLPGIDPDIEDNSIDAHYWTNVGGTAAIIQNSTEYNSWVSNLAPNVNSFRWYLEKGKCVDYEEIQVVNQGVTASAKDVSTCTMPVELDGSPPPAGATGEWSYVAGTYTWVDDNTLYNARITDIPLENSASLVWTVTKGSCSDATDPITVTNNNFALSAGNDDATCSGEIQLNGQEISGGTGFWKIMAGAGVFDNSTDRQTWVRNLAVNDNVLRWTVDNGNCVNYADVTISNNQVTAQLSATTMVVCESKATLNAIDPSPHTGLWESLDAADDHPIIQTPSVYNSLVTGLKPGSNTFKWTVFGNGGCKDEATLNIINDTVILASDQQTEICADATSLWANDPSPNTGVWTSVGLNAIVQNSTQYDSPVSNLDQGTNTFYWTVTSANGGCKSTQKFDIINNLPDPANAGIDVTICENSYQLNANNPIIGTGQWSVVSGNGDFDDNTLRDTYVRNLQPGANEFKWTITNKNCTSEDNVIINSNAISANAGLDQLDLCATTTTLNAILNNSSDESGVWSVIGGNAVIDNSLSETTTVTDLDKGNNTFRWTVTNTAGCSAYDDVLVVNNIPVKPVTDPDIDDCEFTQAVKATAPPVGGTGIWTRIAGSGTFDDPTNYNPVIISGLSNINTNKFEWKVTVNGCSNSDTITIINNGVTASVDPDASTCDDFYTLRAVDPNVGTGVWEVLSGNGILDNSLNNETLVTNLTQGDNSFRWTVTRGACSDYDEITITNNAPDDANAGSDISTCDASITLLGNDPSIGTGIWTKSAGSTATIDNPSLFNTAVNVPVKANPYSEIFTWTITNNGCSSSSTVTVNQNGFLNSANADDYTCDGTYKLLGRDPSTVSATATGIWTVTAGNGVFDNSLAYDATVSDLNLDANTLVWTISDNGCSASEEVIIINDKVIARANEGATASICNDYRPITANDPSLIGATGAWSLPNPNGQTIDQATDFNTTVRNLTEGNNLLTWTVTKNSCSEDTTITIEYYVPNAYIAMGDITHGCADTVQLMADAPPATGSGLWTLKYGSTQVTIEDNTANNTMARNLEIGDNVFVWTVSDRGCVASDEVTINNSMPINVNGTDQSGCTSDFVMNAQEPTATGSGLWTVVSSPGTPVIANETLASTAVSVPYGTTQLKWTISDNGCDADKFFNITNNQPNAVAGDGSLNELCVNEVQLSGNDPNSALGETGFWSIDGGATTEVFDDSTDPKTWVRNLRQGQITFVWTISNAYCTDEDRAVYINNTPVVYAGSDRTICEDEANLAGNVPESGATGLWTISSSTVVIDNNTLYNTHVSNLGNNNLFTWTIDNGKCTASDDVIITSRAFKVSAGLSYQEACADTLVLDATDPTTVGTGTGTGVWTIIEGTGTVDNETNFSTIARSLRGYNKLRWTITDYPENCSYYGETAFQSLLPTVIAKTSDNKAVCDNYTQITASEPNYAQGETGLWSMVSGGTNTTISNPTAFQTQVTNLVVGTNIFKWTISNENCDDSDNITITNNQVFADAGNDQDNVCDSSATISANLLSGTGYWTTTSPTATIVNSLATTTEVNNLSFGANNFQWIVTNKGCSDIDEVIVTSILPRNVDAGADQDICRDWTNLAASNPGIGSGIWTSLGGSTNISFDDATANQTIVRGMAQGSNRFRWTVTVSGCSEYDEVVVNNNSLYVTAGTDQVLCNNDTLVLDGYEPSDGVTGLWTVSGGYGEFDHNTLYNTVVRNINKGTNTFRWTLSDGNCSNYAEVTVTNNTPDPATVGDDQAICSDQTTISAIPVTVGTGSWSVTSGEANIVNPTSYTTNVTSLKKGSSEFTWTVEKNGCTRSASLTVTNNSVDAYIADKEVVICTDTHTATIIGNAPGTGETGYWTKQNPADAGIIVNSNSNVTDVTDLANGDTYFTWTIENGLCSNSDAMKVTDNYYNTTANPAGPNTLCVDYSPILGGTPPAGGTGKWTSTAPDVTFDDDTQVSTIVRNLPGGTSTITWTITKDGCSAPASFDLINNAIYTSAGADQVVCTDYTTMNAQALLSGETGQWTVNNTSVIIADTSDPTTAVTNLIPGANTFTWTIQGNGCTATDEITVSANAFSVTAGNDDIACGTSYNLAASDPLTGTGIWTVASGTGRFANPSNFETTVYDMENGANTFTWTVQRNGCTASDDVTISNNLYIAVAGDDKSICSDQTTVSAQPLNPVWGATGMWTAQTGGGVFSDPTNESTLVTGLAIGNNRLRWTVTKTENGTTCVSYDEMIVTNNTVTASAGTDETTCDDFTTLSATPLNPGATGLWTGGGVTTTIVDPTSASTLVTGLQQGVNTFAWTVQDNGCEGTSTVKITSNYFVANAGGDQIVTVSSATMNAQLPDATATGTWSIVSGNGTFTNANDPDDVVTALGYGVNTFRWTVEWNSCSNYDDVNITYNSITADAGENQTICGPVTSMNAADPFPGTGTWSVISGSATIADIHNPNTQVSDIQPGSLNILRWTVEISGYSEFDDVSILNGEFEISAGIDKEECSDETIMTAEDPGTGTGDWSVLVGGGNFEDNSLNTSRVTNLSEGTNLFVWSVTKPTGCSNSDTVQIIYNLPPNAAFEMDQSAGCSPIDVTFTNTTTGGSVYYWNFEDDIRTDSSLTSFTRTYEAIYDADSTYYIRLVAESSKGCTDTTIQSVTVYRIPLVEFSATPESQLYPRSEVYIENLSGDEYQDYYWDMGDGNTYLHSTMVENFSHTYGTWGEYTITLTVSANNCSDTARHSVVILPPDPESTIKPGIRGQGCEDLSINFESYINYADTFYWDFGDGGSSNEQNPTYIYDTPGTFIVTLYAGGPGTEDSLIVVRQDTVIVFEEAIADFEVLPDTVMLPDQPIICHNNSINADKFQWNFGSVTDSISTEKSPIHYYTEEGIYTITLEVWSENNCYDTKTIENAVVVEPAGTFVFPTAFNPYSNYEINKVFKPKYRGVKEYKLEIYNRWGAKVFESTDPEQGWDGYIDGKIGSQDVYVWKVTGKYKNGAPFSATGDVTIVR